MAEDTGSITRKSGIDLPGVDGMVRLTYRESTGESLCTVTLSTQYGERTVSKSYEVPLQGHKSIEDFLKKLIEDTKAQRHLEVYSTAFEAVSVATRLGETI